MHSPLPSPEVESGAPEQRIGARGARAWGARVLFGGGSRTQHRASLLAGLGAAIVMGAITAFSRRGAFFPSDYDQLWIAGRALLDGLDPYTAVRLSGNEYPLYYPLPAVLTALPLAPLPLGVARITFSTLAAFVAGYGLARLGPWTTLALLSPLWWAAAIQGQLAPALAGAALVPPLGFLLAAKPTIGIALWISRPTRVAAISILAVLLLSLAVQPSWPMQWFSEIAAGPAHIRPPVLRPWGAVLLLAWLRWRIPEGRLLGTWAMLPRTESIYDLLPLFLLTFSWSSAAFLLVASLGTLLALAAWAPLPGGELAPRLDAIWPFVLVGCYLPALGLVFMRPADPQREEQGLAAAETR
jgi:hypothetical protein